MLLKKLLVLKSILDQQLQFISESTNAMFMEPKTVLPTVTVTAANDFVDNFNSKL